MKSHIISTPLLALSLFFVSACGGSNGGGGGDGESVVFNPRNPEGQGPAPVSLSKDGGVLSAGDLGSAGSYVILAKTGISDVVADLTRITGNIGVSPVAASYITNFSLAADGTTRSTSSKVIGGGYVYASNYAAPTPSNLTTAIGSMETAYTDAAGRTPPDYTELHAGDLSGKTLTPGLYKWGTNVVINAGDVTISGSATDVWIFQIAENLTMATSTRIHLAGGALPENIFWQVAGQVTLEAGAHFEGIILAKTAIVLKTGATMNGRAFAQTAVTLDDNDVVQP